MRILILTQWFDPEPTFKGLVFATALKSQGHEVEVLTGYPNYPGGKLYPGYRVQLFSRELMDGVRVNRVALFPSHNNSGILRIINYMSFFFSSVFVGPFLIQKPDVIYVCNLPTLGFVANVFRLIFGSKIVLDILDLWPESVTKSGMLNGKVALSLLEKATNYIYRLADHITTISPGIKRVLVSRGMPPDKLSVVYNWCSERAAPASDVLREFAEKHDFIGKFNIVFAGNMGKMQALEPVLEAASIIWPLNKKASFWFVGDGVEVEHLREFASSRSLSYVHFIPRMSSDEIANLFKMSDLLLVHLKKDPLFQITIPSKIQAYMFAGKCILVGVEGDAAALVQAADAGFACEPENPDSIAASILKFSELDADDRQRMGQNGRRYYEQNLSLKVGAARFVDIFKNVMKVK